MAAKWKYYYAVKGLEVSRNGAVRRTYDDCRTWDGKSIYPIMLERQIDVNGNLYVEIRKPKRMNLRIDRLVATCFLPKPNWGQTLIIHKDKVKEHCWAGNLQWVTPYEHAVYYIDDPTVNTPDGFRMIRDGLYISKDAQVKENGEILRVIDSFYDPDIDREVSVRPYFCLSGDLKKDRKYFLEEMMVEVYLPVPREINYPVLLHKDLNYMNCSLNNLEWVERDCEEFLKYYEKMKADMEERMKELNPHVQHVMFRFL